MLESVIPSIGKEKFGNVLFDALHWECAHRVGLYWFRDAMTEMLAASDDREDSCVHWLA